MSTTPLNYFVCTAGPYTGWKDEWYCINPYSWADFGIAGSLFFSIIGAAWYPFPLLPTSFLFIRLGVSS